MNCTTNGAFLFCGIFFLLLVFFRLFQVFFPIGFSIEMGKKKPKKTQCQYKKNTQKFASLHGVFLKARKATKSLKEGLYVGRG